MGILTELEPSFGPHIINMNDQIFSGKESSRIEFIKKLVAETATPTSDDILVLSGRAFSGPQGPIVSDCLNPNDVALFARVFMTVEFENTFIQHDLAAVRRCSGIARTADVDQNWEAFSALIDEQVNALEVYTSGICKDSQTLIDHGTLSLERRSEHVRKLCKYNQCRLKSCFVQAEDRIMMMNLKNAIELNDELWKSAEFLRSEGFFRSWDFEKVAEAYKENTSTMAANAQELGFTDARELVVQLGQITGGCSALHGAFGVMSGSPVFASASMGGTLSSIVVTASPAGLLLIIGSSVFLLGTLVNQFCFAHGDEYSGAMATKLLSAFHALKDASEAATNHKRALVAITSTLRSLEIPVRD